MIVNELLQAGVYGIKDIKKGKIVYVGSTKVTFLERLAHHFRDIRDNRHSNSKLVELFKSKQFEFIVLETGDFNSFELLERERYYSQLYSVYEEGIALHIGGCNVNTEEKQRLCKMFPKDDKFKITYNFIKQNYLDKRIGFSSRDEIINFCNEMGYSTIRTSNFAVSMGRFGFKVIRLKTRRDYIIKEF